MKRWICVLLLGLLILGSASAAESVNEYALSPFTFDAPLILKLAFGDQVDKAQLNTGEWTFYDLPGSYGGPYCGQNDTYGFGQMDLSIDTALASAEQHEPDFGDNVEPSGVVRCTLTAEEARAQAEALLAELGVSDYYFQSVTAYGKMEKLAAGYRIAFGQSLDGVPVYWAACTHVEETTVPSYTPQSNRLLIEIGDSGLVRISGCWSIFTPAKQNISALSASEAVAVLADLGEEAASAERCYLLTGTYNAPVALPAYRFQNRFISAENGAVLQ